MRCPPLSSLLDHQSMAHPPPFPFLPKRPPAHLLSRLLAMRDASNPDDAIDLASTINMPRAVRKKAVPPKKVLMDA